MHKYATSKQPVHESYLPDLIKGTLVLSFHTCYIPEQNNFRVDTIWLSSFKK